MKWWENDPIAPEQALEAPAAPAPRKPDAPRFDPYGSDYDMASAEKQGITADETGHYPSLAPLSPDEASALGLPPESGLVLKGRGHQTFHKTLEAEKALGRKIIEKDSRLYSVPASADSKPNPGEPWKDDPLAKEQPLPADAGFLKTLPKALHEGSIRTVGALGSGIESKGHLLRKQIEDPSREVLTQYHDQQLDGVGLTDEEIAALPKEPGMFLPSNETVRKAREAKIARLVEEQIQQGRQQRQEQSPFPTEQAIISGGQVLSKWAEEYLNEHPELMRSPELVNRPWTELLADPRTRGTYLARAFGENAPNLAAGIVAYGIGGPGGAALFTQTLESGYSFEDLKQLTGDEQSAAETANSVGMVNALLETVPIARLFHKSPGLKRLFMDELTQEFASKPFLRRAFSEGLKQALVEGGTEGLQEINANFGKRFYDKHQDLFQGVPEAMFIGALLGGPSGAAGQIGAGQPQPTDKTQPPQPSQPPPAQPPPAAPVEPTLDGDIDTSIPGEPVVGDITPTPATEPAASAQTAEPEVPPATEPVTVAETEAPTAETGVAVPEQPAEPESAPAEPATDTDVSVSPESIDFETSFPRPTESALAQLPPDASYPDPDDPEAVRGFHEQVITDLRGHDTAIEQNRAALKTKVKKADRDKLTTEIQRLEQMRAATLSEYTSIYGEDAAKRLDQAARQRHAEPATPETAEPTAPEVPPVAEGFTPKDGWESHIAKAREYAVALGIDTKGKKRDQLVAEIKAQVGGGQQAEPEAPSAIDEAAGAAATSPENDKPEPSAAQKAAGIYEKGHYQLHGLNVAIENPRDSYRFKVDTDAISGIAKKAPPEIRKRIERALEMFKDSAKIPDAFQALAEARKHANLKRQFSVAHDLNAVMQQSWHNRMAHHYGDIKRTEGHDGDPVDVFLGPGVDDAALPVFVVDQVHESGEFDEHKVMLGFPDEQSARAGYLANYPEGWKGIGAIRRMTLEEFKTWLKGDTTRRTTRENEKQPPSESPADPAEQMRDRSKADILRALVTLDAVQEIAKANKVEGFAKGAEKHVREQIRHQLEDASTPAQRAALESMLEGDKLNAEVFDDQFFGTLYAETLKHARRAERERLKAEWAEALAAEFAKGAQAVGITDLESEAGKEFRIGWDHAIDGKTKSTLPKGDHVLPGYEAARQWLQTEEGSQFAKGARGKKLKGTGDQLRRIQDGWKKLTSDIDAITGENLDNALASIFKATARADVFQVAVPEDATPGTRRYVDIVRSRIEPFKEWVTSGQRIFGYGRNRENKIREYVDSAGKLEELKVWAKEYNAAVESIAEALSGAKTVDQAVSAFSAIGETTKRDFMHRRYRQLGDKDSYVTRELKRDEQKEDAAMAARKQPLMRPRFDRVERDERPDYRKGLNITAQDLKDTFGFADVTIGEWVSSKQAQDHMNYAFDAFHDLADTLGIKPKDISLGGKLYVAFGALGRGRHAAHYSPNHPHPQGGDVAVINLTNTRGDGTVAHEWFHALDYALRERHRGSRTAAQSPGVAQIVEGLKHEPWTVDALHRYIESTRWTRMGRGANELDHMKFSVQRLGNSFDRLLAGSEIRDGYARGASGTDYKRQADILGEDYWGNREELWARAGEAYVFDRIKGEDTYLVTDWVADGKVTKQSGYRGTPYAMGDERVTFNEYFEHFFSALQWDEQGPSVPDSFRSPFIDQIAALQKALEDYAAQMPKDMRELNEQRAREKAAAEAKKAEETKKVAEEQMKKLREQYQQGSDAGTQIQSMTTDEMDALFDEVANQEDEAAQEPRPAPPADEGSRKLVSALRDRLVKPDAKLSWQELFAEADKAFGGTQAEGAYNPKAAYDALEAAVNEHIDGLTDVFLDASEKEAVEAMQRLKALDDRLPTQTKRTLEQEELQQFSTPHPYAFAMAWAADISPGQDVVLEPSAGTGNIAVMARKGGAADVVVNELADYRAALLEIQNYHPVYRENAEQIHNILPAEMRPTVVLMNPPFSATAGRMEGKRDTMVGAQHVEQALKRLQPGGRLVALVGKGMAMDRPAFFSWWAKIRKEYTVRANIGVEGKGYAKFGTTFDNQILVIDKTGPTKEDVLTGQVDDITEVVPLLAEVRRARTHPTERFTDQQGREAVAGEGSAGPRAGAALQPATDEVGAGQQSGRSETEEQAGGAGDGGADAGAGAEPGDAVPDGARGGRSGRRPGGINPQGAGRRPGASKRPASQDGGDDSGVPASVKSASDIAKDAAKHGVKGIDESLKGLHELFGGNRLKSFPSGFDEEAYAKAKPHFERALKEFVAAGRDIKEFVRFIIRNFGKGIKPYLIRFMEDYKAAGKPSTPDVPVPESLEVEAATQEAQTEQLTDAIYEQYRPSVTIAGAKPHPGKLVESAAMSSVTFPKVSYRPNLPKQVVEKGMLSDAQIEAIILAGASHSQTLPEGQRRGFFVGDGTGTGKGRVISGIILDNWQQGRKKAVWLSEKSELFHDARRDFSGVGGNPDLIFNLSKIAGEAPVKNKAGILYTTYATLKSSAKDVKDAKGDLIRKGKTRLEQVVEWLGEGFDGVIVFDESHNMGNNMDADSGGAFGKKKATQTAISGVELQNKLPNARVVYVSATGATEVHNLGYAERLGLWGKGTPFNNKNDFTSKISAGGIATMEAVAMNMKAMGTYIARSLAYSDVTYGMLEHPLTPQQLEVYNELVRAWQIVLANLGKALEATGITDNGKTKNGRAKAMAMSKFWSAHQRFFNQVLTSIQMPAVLESIEKETGKGNVAVLQLVNTNEAAQERAAARLEQEDRDLDDLDITPRESLMQYLQAAFPTTEYEEYTDENGNTQSRPVLDSSGNPVQSREALAMRDELLMKVGALKVPDNPIDLLVNHFGHERVAEVTGRKRRFVRVDGKMTEQKLGPAKALADANAFMADNKDILVFSDKGGTGRSYHADLTAKNQKRRVHYLVQPGWRADKALQGFGRTHRTNQASAPHYNLVTTNLKAQRRFLSSVARRLDQLGALTRGQRQAGSQGIFTAEFNLETQYAVTALYNMILDVNAGKVEGLTLDVIEKQMALPIRDKDGNITQKEIPTIPRFLNRLLSVETDTMDRVFDAFFQRLEDVIEHARAEGTLDAGVENIVADSITREHEEVVYQDPSGAEAKYVKLKLEDQVKPTTFEQAMEFSFNTNNPILFFARNKRSGHVYAFFPARDATDKQGNIKQRYRRMGPLTKDIVLLDDVGDPNGGPREYATFKQKWEHLSDLTEVKKAWEEDIESAPKTKVYERHLVTGAILPVWDRILGDPRIVRIQTDAGERLIGRLIPEKGLHDTLKRLGAEGSKVKLTPAQLVDRVLGGATLELANGWRIQTRRVSGGERIEISGASYSDLKTLEADGAFAERIGWETRFFIPTGDKAAEVLGKVIQYRPVVSIRGGGMVEDEPGSYGMVEAPKGGYDVSRGYEGSNPTPEQRRLGQEAVTALSRTGRAPVRGGTILGSVIPREFAEEGAIKLLGHKVTSPHDLAKLAQVYRDPRFETFRIFFVKDGRVVDQTGLTSRLPGNTPIVTGQTIIEQMEYISSLMSRMERTGADGYYLLHNHPSGVPKASRADMVATVKYAKELPGFKGHVIIDETKYGVIIKGEKGMADAVIEHGFASRYQLWKDPEVPHRILRTSVVRPADLAAAAKAIQIAKGHFVLIGSNRSGVTGIMELPVSILSNKLKATAAIRRFARSNGSARVFVAGLDKTPENQQLAVSGVWANLIDDVVWSDGSTTFHDQGFMLAKMDSGDNVLGRRSADTRAMMLESEKGDYGDDTKLKSLLSKIGAQPQSLRQRYEGFMDSLGDRLNQGAFDRLYGIRRALDSLEGKPVAEQDGYIAARFTTSLAPQVLRVLRGGPLQWREGMAQTKKDSKGLLEIFQPVADKLDLWSAYMVAKRAQRLALESREHLLTDEEINRGLRLAKENPEFVQVANDWAAFNRSMLDFAQGAGLIDPEAREIWEHDDYIPFYRLLAEDRVAGPRGRKGLSHQSSGIRVLKGGETNINDILENIIQNTVHLIDASMKNRAMDLTITALEGTEMLTPAPYEFKPELIPMSQVKKVLEGMGVQTDHIPKQIFRGIQKMLALHVPKGRDVVMVRRNGRPAYYYVHDELLLRALTAVNEVRFGPWMGIFRGPKRLVTTLITAAPDFMARNWFRDTLHSFVISRDNVTPMFDGAKGLVKAFRGSDVLEAVEAAGAGFHGGYIHAGDPAAVSKVIKTELRHQDISRNILDTPRKLWDFWMDVSYSFENANRIAVAESALKSGKSKLQAAYEFKDLMDFSMHGDWTIIQFIVQSVPFVGARIQGLQRMGRGAIENPKAFAAKGSLIMLAGLALYLRNMDDERYKALEDWDKNTYYHFWIGDHHFRIPKPFEVGAIFGTIPERMTEFLLSDLPDAEKRFLHNLLWVISEMLNFGSIHIAGVPVPAPQTVAPILEQWANEETFTERPIVSQSLQRLRPEAQYNAWTSASARALGETFGLSPKRIEHLVRGYFGTMGAYALGASDVVVRRAMDYPEEPAGRLEDMPVIKSFYRGTGDPRYTHYGTDFYELFREIDETYRTIQNYRKLREHEKGRQLLADEQDILKYRGLIRSTKERINRINRKIKAIHESRALTPEQKRDRIDNLIKQRNANYRMTIQTIEADRRRSANQ